MGVPVDGEFDSDGKFTLELDVGARSVMLSLMGATFEEPANLFRFLVDKLIAHRTREHWEVWRGDRPPGPGSPLTRVQVELNGILLMLAERSHDVGALAAHVHVFTEAERCEVCGFDRSA